MDITITKGTFLLEEKGRGWGEFRSQVARHRSQEKPHYLTIKIIRYPEWW